MSPTIDNLKTAHAYLSELADLLEGVRHATRTNRTIYSLATSAADLVSASIADLEGTP